MNLVFPRLYAIIDASLLTASELALAEALAGSGVELIQIRNKTASSRHFFEVSLQLSQALKPRGVRFIVNDRPDIALLTGAGGVHVGQADLGVEEARAICGRGATLGWEFRPTLWNKSLRRTALPPTTLHSARFFPRRPSKIRMRSSERNFCDARASRTAKPLVEIGGITLSRAAEVYRAGCGFAGRDPRLDLCAGSLARGRVNTSK